MPQEVFLSVEKAFDRLLDASKVIQNRLGVKPAEDKRINAAFTLLAGGQSTVGAKQREVYLDFLRRVRTVLSLSMVVLCAAGLGPSAVSNMRDRVRVDLPHRMKERENELTNAILQSLADGYAAKMFPQIHRNTASDTHPQPRLTETSSDEESLPHDTIKELWQGSSLDSFTGDVYELTVEDARMVAISDQISGKIWLTDTYENTTSFITIPISHELTSQFIIHRPRIM